MQHITSIGQKGLNLIIESEGCILHPYVDPGTGNLPITIGIGSTYYADGRKIKLTDEPITKEEAILLLKLNLKHYEQGVDSITRDDITQNMFDGLVSFAYNLGLANLKSSTLLKLINTNPNNVVPITQEWLKWNRAAGKVMKGLTLRRQNEVNLFFS